jgi:IclR family transcriptional regulator, acetate operon repressor
VRGEQGKGLAKPPPEERDGQFVALPTARYCGEFLYCRQYFDAFLSLRRIANIEISIDAKINDSGYRTPGLDRALAVLECLGKRSEGSTQTEIAGKLGLTANFVCRTTQALTAHGYLTRDPEKRLRLSGKLRQLCQPVLDDVPLAEAALPTMPWLSEETGEAAHLGILVASEGLVLERVIGTASIKFYVERGSRFPVHTSAPGKCILAFASPGDRETAVAALSFEAFHPWTISNAADFLRCLDEAKREGFSTDLGEHLEGDHCLGAPILERAGTAVASLWITGPSRRLDERRIAELAPIVKEAGRLASSALRGEAVR